MSRAFCQLAALSIGLLTFAGTTSRAAMIIDADVTIPSDSLLGVAAVAGSVSSTPNTNYPAAEDPPKAIDNSLSTKYLNFDKVNVGLIVHLDGAGNSIISSVRMATANDSAERDPLSISIEGTTSGGATPTALATNATWTLLYSGSTGLETDPGRLQWGPSIAFANASAFDAYRVLVTSVRNASSANSMQFGEIELIGTNVVPEPATLGLLASGCFLLLRRRARK